MRRFSFLILTFAFSVVLYGKDTASQAPAETDSVLNTISLRKQTNSVNKADINLLWLVFESKIGNMDINGFNELINDARAMMRKDKKIFADVKKILDSKTKEEDKGCAALNVGIQKLAGKGRDAGLLTNASVFAATLKGNEQFFRNGPVYEDLKLPEVVLMKIVLIYLMTAADKKFNLQHTLDDNLSGITLVYPLQLPKSFENDILSETVLAVVEPSRCYELREFTMSNKPEIVCGRERKIMLPNAGYVFGGFMFPDGKGNMLNRGIDCSSFLSAASGSDIRTSTLLMEYVWKLHKFGYNSLSSSEKETADFLFENWDLAGAMTDYVPVDPYNEKLKKGDIIVWRCRPNAKMCMNHTAMYIRGNKYWFYGAEAVRTKNDEGIREGNFKLFRPNRNTYVLRRKFYSAK